MQVLSARVFEPYHTSHWVVLALFAIGAVALVSLGRRRGHTAAARRFTHVFGAVILAILIGELVYYLLPAHWTLGHSLPLQLSDLAGLSAAYALFSMRQWAYSLTYYWGLTLSPQALLTPVLYGPDFPNWQFVLFWAWHFVVVWAAIYLTWGLGMRPTWRSYRLVVTVTVCWAAFLLVFNHLAGTNYGYLNAKPAIGTVLNVLGPWPWYLIPEAILVFGIWALITWPWERATRRRVPDLRVADQ